MNDGPQLPSPVSVTDEYLAAAVARLDRIEQLLSERLPDPVAPAPTPNPADEPIEITEPAPRKRPPSKPSKASAGKPPAKPTGGKR